MIDKLSLQPLMTVKAAEPKTLTAAEVSDQFSRFLNGAIADLNAQQAGVDKLNNQIR